MEYECMYYLGKDDNERIIFIEKKNVSANDKTAIAKSKLVSNAIQKFINQGYKVVDVAKLSPEDYAYYLNLVRTLAGEKIEESSSMSR